MKAQSLKQNNSLYPTALYKYLTNTAPMSITALGNFDILKNKPLAVFSSSKCPAKIILQTHDLMKKIREAGTTVISGFHSPLEQECLNILLKGKQPIIYCPARSIEGIRIKPELKKPLEDGRLLVLSPFTEKEKRISAERALERNRFVAAIADKILVPYAEPNSKTESLVRETAGWGKPLYTFNYENRNNVVCKDAKDILTTFPLVPAPTKDAALQAYRNVGEGLVK